ncbi:MAG: decarboxylase [Candidatus Nanoarchaeia archaeon]
MLDPARFVLSRKKLQEQHDVIKAECDEVSYSSKTNYIVAAELEKMTDCSFSVHTTDALSDIKDKSRVWFFIQACEEDELRQIFSLGVERFVVDNETDLAVLLDFIGKSKKKIDLLLRMRLKEHTIHTGKYFVYGMYSERVNKLLPGLRKNGRIRRLGIHFHRKTQNISEWSMQYELKDLLTEKAIACIDLVNMGGGIPVKYKNFRADVLAHVFKEIRKLKEWLEKKSINLMIEPGRFIAGPCIEMHAKIKNIYHDNIIVNCSVYNAAMDTFIVHTRLEVKGELETGSAFTIKGMTPDAMDIFRYRVFLDNPKVGDEIIFLNAGAYNFSTEFCRLPKLETEII